MLNGSLIAGWAAGLEVLSQSHRWTRDEIRAFQVRRLRALVRHAALRVPYYRGLFERAGIRPGAIRTLDDLSRIPITTRFDLQRSPARENVAEGLNPDSLVLHSTSGTSGQPLRILRTAFEEYLLRALRLKQQLLLGIRVTDRRWSMRGPERPQSMERVPGGRFLTRRLGFLAGKHTDRSLPAEVMLKQLRASPPDLLGGSPSGLAWLAGFVTAEDLDSTRPL